MFVEKIQCVVQMMYDGNPNLMQVVKAGPNAAYAFEIPLFRAMNAVDGDSGDGAGAVTEAKTVDTVRMTTEEITTYLKQKYKPQRLAMVYPGGRGYAKTLDDCELPPEALAPVLPEPKAKKAEVA